MTKIKILIVVLIELGIIALSWFLDFKLLTKIDIFLFGNFIFSFILFVTCNKYENIYSNVFCSLLCIYIFYQCALIIANPHYDSKIEKYNPTQIIKLKSEILLIGNTTYVNSKKLKDYTLDNPKLCREIYFNVANRKITSDWYICE